MMLNDTSTKTGLVQYAERKIKQGDAYISGNATRLLEWKARFNDAGREIWHLIFRVAGNWRYDDDNQTDLPSATQDLVSGTDKYLLPTTALTVNRLEIKDSGGLWRVLEQIPEELINSGIDEYLKTDSTPIYYNLVGETIQLFPATNYNSTAGIKVFFDRSSVDLSDNTDVPGYAAPYHKLTAIKGCIDWYETQKPDSKVLDGLRKDEQRYESAITEFYGKRNKDYVRKIQRLTHRNNSFK